MWVHYKLAGVEIEDGNTGIFHAFEMRIGMNYLIFPNFLSILIENDHLGDWSQEKRCCWQLMF